MVRELLVRYKEDIDENKISYDLFQALENNGVPILRVFSDYDSRLKVFNAKYSFHGKDVSGEANLDFLEKILNKEGLNEKVDITGLIIIE